MTYCISKYILLITTHSFLIYVGWFIFELISKKKRKDRVYIFKYTKMNYNLKHRGYMTPNLIII